MTPAGFRQLPIYRKALELQSMGRAIAFCVSGRGDFPGRVSSGSLKNEVAEALLTDAILIRRQIALAASTPSLNIRRQSLQFISIMIRNLNSYIRGLEMESTGEREYLELMRSELRSFRKSYRAWRRSLV
jgi:hypothetical protein